MCPNCNNRTGYPLLEELCTTCFTALVIQPLRDAADDAEQAWDAATSKRYKVEVAMGLRARPATPEELIAAANRAPTRAYHSSSGDYVPRATRSKEIDEDEVS